MTPETKAKYLELIKGTNITESMIETAYENGALEGEEKGHRNQLQRAILIAFDKSLDIHIIASINECTSSYVEGILKEHHRLK